MPSSLIAGLAWFTAGLAAASGVIAASTPACPAPTTITSNW